MSELNLPTVFIGSSVEGLAVARHLELQLRFEADVTIWKDGLFQLGGTSLESLVNSLSRFDFAVLVLRDDDFTTSRNKNLPAPRDNVIFELGLFVGRLGPQRTYIVTPSTPLLKLPSDLLGVTVATYDAERMHKNAASAVSPAATLILDCIRLHKQRVNETNLLGVQSVSSGRGRDDAFADLRARAQESIVIVGVAMLYLSKLVLHTLEQQAERVPIDILMLDPELVENDPNFEALLSDFFRFNDFAKLLRNSFEALKNMCQTWNNGGSGRKKPKNRMSLHVYRSLPTMSMVMIDASDALKERRGEIVVEFFLYQCGGDRPRLHVRNTGNEEDLFFRTRREYSRLKAASRRCV